MQDVDRGWTSTKQSGQRSAQWTGYSHLGLFESGLRFLIKMKVAGNSPFGGGGCVVTLLPLPPTPPFLYALAHFASRALCTQLVSNHFIKALSGTLLPCPPRGRRCKKTTCARKPQTLLGWLAKYRNLCLSQLSAFPVCPLRVLSTSPFNSPPPSRKRLN